MRNFLVRFALFYLRVLAKFQLFKIRPTIIGIGGASGKSSLAHLTGIVLNENYRILETKGKNNETGIPLSILGLKVQNYGLFEWLWVFLISPFKVLFDWNKYDVLIAEMGIDGPFEPKNMSYLLKIIKPKIGALTNISYEHSIYFEQASKDRNKILDLTSAQEALLLKSLSKEGTAVLNTDDPWINKISGIKASKVLISSKYTDSDFFIEKIESGLRKFKIEFYVKNNRYELKLSYPLPSHYAYSLVMATAIGYILGIPIKDSIHALQTKFSLPPGRMSIFKGKKDTMIIDSSYNNATLVPIMDLLNFLKESRGKRKVAVIGDMRELGIVAKSYHEKVANKLLDSTDLVFLIGPLTQKFIRPILLKNKHKFYSFNTFSEAKNTIKNTIERGDIILVKGSQNTLYLERVVEMLLKNPQDRKNLARRGKFWDKIRSQSL